MLLLLPAHTVQALVVGAVVIPHGDFAYDPSLVHGANGSTEVHRAAVVAGKYIASLRPDIIMLSTPHGVALTNDFAFYTNSAGAGFAAVGGDLQNKSFPIYKVPLKNVSMDQNLTQHLLPVLGANISAVSSFADSEPQALRWGEVIPLSFVPNATLAAARLVVVSQPLRRYTAAAAMVPELLRVGAAAFHALEHAEARGRPLRVVLVASSDLAHTHLASGPYGYSPAAAPFDAAVGQWARDPWTFGGSLLKEAAQLESRALSCGFTSLVMMHGALMASANRSRWSPRPLANRAPTYYGMLVATF